MFRTVIFLEEETQEVHADFRIIKVNQEVMMEEERNLKKTSVNLIKKEEFEGFRELY
jgi:hypothetical protein